MYTRTRKLSKGNPRKFVPGLPQRHPPALGLNSFETPEDCTGHTSTFVVRVGVTVTVGSSVWVRDVVCVSVGVPVAEAVARNVMAREGP